MDVMETMGALDAMLRMSASGSLMILAVILTRAALIYRLPKRTFSFLWTVCALRLVIPAFPACWLSFETLWLAVAIRLGSWETAEDVSGRGWPSGDWMADWTEAGAFSGSDMTGAGWAAVGSAGRAGRSGTSRRYHRHAGSYGNGYRSLSGILRLRGRGSARSGDVFLIGREGRKKSKGERRNRGAVTQTASLSFLARVNDARTMLNVRKGKTR